MLNDEAKRIVAVVHRRGGKSIGLMWRGIRRAAIGERRKMPRVIHLLPYNVMWKRTGLWDRVAEAGAAIPQAEVFKSELAIKFPNGGVYQCGGADNPDSWRGGHADEVICDEFDDMPPKLVELVIEPMLSDRAGTLVRCGTPKGKGLLEAAYKRAQVTEGYSSYLLPHWKTGALSEEAIAVARREMSAEEFAQEFECSFVAPNEGSYYGSLLQDALIEGRITAVPYDPTLKVWTAFDLGIDDATAIWFAQITRSGQWRFIDYIEDSGAGLDHYVQLMQQRPYVYEMHLLPHDASVRELGSGKSRVETLCGLGVMPSRIVRQHSVADGINAVRLVLPRAWFDAERCARGIEALRKYRREWNPAGETWRANPRHDWASHGADAARYLCLGVREDQPEPAPRPVREPWEYAQPGQDRVNWMQM